MEFCQLNMIYKYTTSNQENFRRASSIKSYAEILRFRENNFLIQSAKLFLRTKYEKRLKYDNRFTLSNGTPNFFYEGIKFFRNFDTEQQGLDLHSRLTFCHPILFYIDIIPKSKIVRTRNRNSCTIVHFLKNFNLLKQ